VEVDDGARLRYDNGKGTPFRRRPGFPRGSMNPEVYTRGLNKIVRSNQHNDGHFLSGSPRPRALSS
jgi:hypothetical protein